MTDHLHHHRRSVIQPRPNPCFSSHWASMNHSLNLRLSIETWSGFLGWWQGSMTKPLKVLQNITTCSSWSQKALSTWVSTTCSRFSVFWGCSSFHTIICVQWNVFFHQELLTTHVVTRTNKPTHMSLHSLVMHSFCTGCWDSFAYPDFADCLSNGSKQTRW